MTVTRRPRVGVVDHLAQPSGAQLAISRLAASLDGTDLYFVFGGDGPMVEAARRNGHGATVVPLGALGGRKIAEISPLRDAVLNSAGLSRSVAATARALHRAGVDVVYTNSLKAHIYGGLAARLIGRPWIAHVRDVLAPPYVPRGLQIALRAFFLAGRPDAVVVNSRATGDALRIRGSVEVIPSGIDPNRVAASGARLDSAHRGPLRLGVLGRLEPWKGQHVALAAVAELRRRGLDVQLVVGGDAAHGSPEYERELRETARRNAITDAVEFVGFVDDPYAFFESVHVALHTSVLPEPFGQVIVEALATGRPVIASHGGGPIEILSGGGAGVLSPPGDPIALAEHVMDIAGDTVRYSRMSDAALDRARAFSIERSATRTQRLITELAGPRLGAPPATSSGGPRHPA